jgi:uncharacterized membrane protein YgcG
MVARHRLRCSYRAAVAIDCPLERSDDVLVNLLAFVRRFLPSSRTGVDEGRGLAAASRRERRQMGRELARATGQPAWAPADKRPRRAGRRRTTKSLASGAGLTADAASWSGSDDRWQSDWSGDGGGSDGGGGDGGGGE